MLFASFWHKRKRGVGQSPTLKAKPPLAAEAALNAPKALKGFGQHDAAKPSPKARHGRRANKGRRGKQEFSPGLFTANGSKKTNFPTTHNSFQHGLLVTNGRKRHILILISIQTQEIFAKIPHHFLLSKSKRHRCATSCRTRAFTLQHRAALPCKAYSLATVVFLETGAVFPQIFSLV